jgi:hypothetical protein
MDFLFSGKIEEKQYSYIKKNVESLIKNKPNKAIKVSFINLKII